MNLNIKLHRNRIVTRIIELLRTLYANTLKRTVISKYFKSISAWIYHKESEIKSKNEDILEASYEKEQLGYDTSGNITSKDISKYGDAHFYMPIKYFYLKRIFEDIVLNKDDVFVDIGCGKGRVVVYVSQFEIKKAIGIEISDEIGKNAQDIAAKINTKVPIEIIISDAAVCDLSEMTVFFMYNPFKMKTMLDVINNIKKSLDENPRKIKIIYFIPTYENVMDDTEWLIPTMTFTIEHFGPRTVRMWENRMDI